MSLEIDRFRLLVVDDEDEVRFDQVDHVLAGESDVEVIRAATQGEALAAIRRHVIDAAIVDIELDVEAGGYEVIREFARRAPQTALIVYTQHVDPNHVRELLGLVNEEDPRIVAILEKGPLGVHGFDPEALRLGVVGVIEEWRASRVTVRNAGLALGLLEARAPRIQGFRGEEGEVEAELDRICRRLFGDVRGLAAGAEIGVEFRPIATEGLSPAITVEARVSLGVDAEGEPVDGSRCVLKIGPVVDIGEEVDRYKQFVKYGVRLRQRVELLGETRLHALGAVCYSFAGGVFGRDLISLSELFLSDRRTELGREAISSLFNSSSRNWYAVQCTRIMPLEYATKVYKTDFRGCFERLDRSLEKLQRRLRGVRAQELLGGYLGYSRAEDGNDGRLEVGGTYLAIPRRNIFGGGKFLAPQPACLVHGDMHGANVMLELGPPEDGEEHGALSRVCLIDYRSAGPGPRATDFLTLQASLRLADARLIADAVCGEGGPRGLSDAQLAEAVAVAAGRVGPEARLLDRIGGGPDGEGRDDSHWEALDSQITAEMRENFGDLGVVEYLTTAMPFVWRYFSLGLDPVSRVRLLAWASAQHSVMQTMTGELALPRR